MSSFLLVIISDNNLLSFFSSCWSTVGLGWPLFILISISIFKSSLLSVSSFSFVSNFLSFCSFSLSLFFLSSSLFASFLLIISFNDCKNGLLNSSFFELLLLSFFISEEDSALFPIIPENCKSLYVCSFFSSSFSFLLLNSFVSILELLSTDVILGFENPNDIVPMFSIFSFFFVSSIFGVPISSLLSLFLSSSLSSLPTAFVLSGVFNLSSSVSNLISLNKLLLLKLLEPENKSDLRFLRSKPKPGKRGLDSVSFSKIELLLSLLRFNPGNNGVFDSFLTSIVCLFKPNPGNNDVEVFLGIAMSVFALDNSNFGKSDDVVLNSNSLLLLSF